LQYFSAKVVYEHKTASVLTRKLLDGNFATIRLKKFVRAIDSNSKLWNSQLFLDLVISIPSASSPHGTYSTVYDRDQEVERLHWVPRLTK
jgi:hypothetical protein